MKKFNINKRFKVITLTTALIFALLGGLTAYASDFSTSQTGAPRMEFSFSKIVNLFKKHKKNKKKNKTNNSFFDNSKTNSYFDTSNIGGCGGKGGTNGGCNNGGCNNTNTNTNTNTNNTNNTNIKKTDTNTNTNTNTTKVDNTTNNTTNTTNTSGYANPKDYESKTTVSILNANTVDRKSHTSEFYNLSKNCTKVAYAYADPRENANKALNTNKNGAKSFAGYIFGYDNTTEIEFLNTKIAISYVLNKLYFDKSLSSWYKELINKHGLYMIIEPSNNLNGAAGVKFGNPNDGFGMRIVPNSMKDRKGGGKLIYHELSHSIWDCGVHQNNFKFGKDPKTGKDYGTGNFIDIYTKYYNDSISKNNFYANMYGWKYVHENYAESASLFFDAGWREQFKQNDPMVYNIMKQIYNEF